MIKTIILFLFAGLYSCITVAQQRQIVFFDKKENPNSKTFENVVSEKTLQKRALHNIGFDKYDQTVNKSYLEILKQNNIKIISTSKWLNAALVEVTDTTIDLAQTQSFINWALPISERNYRNPSKFEIQRNIIAPSPVNVRGGRNTNSIDYGVARIQNNYFEIEHLHNQGFTGNGVTIAFLDAGFDRMDTLSDIADLYTNNRVLDTYNYWDDSPNVFMDSDHGTMVSFIVLGNTPGRYVGMAPDVNVNLYLTDHTYSETHQDEYFFVKALERADSIGVDIISASIGYQDFDPGEYSYTYQDFDGNTAISTLGANIAAQKEIVVVNAAGNADKIKAPADAFGILAVGGAKKSRVYDNRSSQGPTYDGRIAPNIAGLTQGAQSIMPDGSFYGGNYGGTSSATPFISGFAACLMEAHPLRSSLEIIEAIKQSGHQYNAPDSLLGYGIPNARIADSLLAIIDGVDDTKETPSLVQVFPNPSISNVSFQSENPIQSIQLFSITGKRVKNIENLKQNYYHLNDLKPGVFIYQVVDFNGNRISGKLVVAP